MLSKQTPSLIVLIGICNTALVLGMLVFALKSHYIIIRGTYNAHQEGTAQPEAHKKEVSLYYHRNDSWHKETVCLLWLNDLQQNYFALVQQWLFMVYQEQMIHKKVMLQSAIISPDKRTLYLSFDRAFLSKEATTEYNWFLIEALLLTIKPQSSILQSVQLLINHQPLHDPHLDCSRPWPLQGFLVKT